MRVVPRRIHVKDLSLAVVQFQVSKPPRSSVTFLPSRRLKHLQFPTRAFCLHSLVSNSFVPLLATRNWSEMRPDFEPPTGSGRCRLSLRLYLKRILDKRILDKRMTVRRKMSAFLVINSRRGHATLLPSSAPIREDHIARGWHWLV